MRKKFISILLVVCMAVTMMPIQALAESSTSQTGNITQQTNPFSDVTSEDWFYDDVMNALNENIFGGSSSTTFSPYENMTRAMYVTVLGRVAGINTDSYGGNGGFADVVTGEYYAPYVNWAVQKNITNGVGDKKFDPDGLITREQMAALTVRFFDAYGIAFPADKVNTTPEDFSSISDWAKNDVMKLWKCELLKGDDKGSINPLNNTSRAEGAAFFGRTNTIVKEWKESEGIKTVTYTVSFMDGKTLMAKESVQEGKILSKTPSTAKSGYTFVGWYTNEALTTAFSKNTPITADMTVYAKYTVASTGGGGGGSGHSAYTVTFKDGVDVIGKETVQRGKTLTKTPDASKEGYIFTGWVKLNDEAFYKEDPVNSDITVYAKYEKMPDKETLSLTSFAQTDTDPKLSFVITGSSGLSEDAVMDKLTLMAMDGSEPVELKVTALGNGEFNVAAAEGFNEGASYELKLADGLNFKGKAETIRTASFTIKQDEVANLSLDDSITYIKDTAEMNYIIGGKTVPMIEAALLNTKEQDALSGTFEYSAGGLSVDEVLCIYETTDPRERDILNKDYSDDSIAYIKVTGISGNTISFKSLDEESAQEVLFIPDTLPFSVNALPTGATGTVDSSVLDTTAWAGMGMSGSPKIDVGDFVVFYAGSFAAMTEATDIYYGKVTKVNGTELEYVKVDAKEIEESMDLFKSESVKGDVLLEGVDTAAIEAQVKQQVEASGFAEDAAAYLAAMAIQTDGFNSAAGLKDLIITDENGNPISEDTLELMGMGKSFELSEDVKLTVELDKSSKYFADGIRFALGIEAQFSVDVGSEDGELKIILKATFVEELAVKVKVKGKAKIKWYFIIPVVKDLGVNASVDLKNYAGVSVDVMIYTVEKEEEGDWGEFTQLKEVFDKAKDLEEKIKDAKETAEKLQGYKEDLEKLLATVSDKDKQNYESYAEAFGEMNVTEELKELLNLTDETELDAGIQNLMERYAKMLENESDWITLFNQEIFSCPTNPDGLGIVWIETNVNFVIKGNVNIALGANMEYVVGKRYNFWFNIFSRTGGSSQQDLLDEKFAFQFYVMGAIGLKMGLEAGICTGLFSTDLDSIGISAEFGPYVELWGYFIYEYSKMRPANTNSWNYDEKMMGALYLEFGLYLEMKFTAQLGKGALTYQPTLVDEKWPLLSAGTRLNVYDFGYDIDEDEVVLVEDSDNNSTTGITMTLPESFRSMSYIDLKEGDMAADVYPEDKFAYTLSNRYFKLDEKTGLITVTVPEGVHYMKCDLTLTWKMDKLAFSSKDITSTIPLVWTDLGTSELNQKFTAAVKVGNAENGYVTVWSDRVNKGELFDLPDETAILKLLNYDSYNMDGQGNLRYSAYTGYGTQATADQSIIKDQSYYFDVTPRSYTLTVNGVEKTDGTTENRSFTAKYGESFNLASLLNSGTDSSAEEKYTSYLKTTVKDSSGKDIERDIAQPIGTDFAAELLSGAVYTANYADNAATVTYKYEGVDLEDKVIKVKKGTVPPDVYSQELEAKNAVITDITPAIGPILGATTYTISCKVIEVPIVKHTISYETNGGSTIAAKEYAVGSPVSAPNEPTKAGYEFDGWYSDVDLSQPYTFTVMPDEDITLYAKWKGEEFTVTYDANEGEMPDGAPESITVEYGSSYGELVKPVRSGFAFAGWYTDRVEGERVTEDTEVTLTDDQTLYAHWTDKNVLEKTVIEYESGQSFPYDGAVKEFTFTSGELEGFELQYKRQNLDADWTEEAVNAGTYDIKVTRAEDDDYAAFEATYIAAMQITKIDRSIDAPTGGESYYANVLVNEVADGAYPGDGIVEYAVSKEQTAPQSGWQEARSIMNLAPGTYYLFARVCEGENYWTATSEASPETVTITDYLKGNQDWIPEMRVKTSNIKNAGTNSLIYGRYYFVDGSMTDLIHFDSDDDDFEQGDDRTYPVSKVPQSDSNMRMDPWMISDMEIAYSRKGSSAGWHCEFLQGAVYNVKATPTGSVGRVFEIGEVIPVSKWFEDSYMEWKASTGDRFKRNITEVGNFNSIENEMKLSSADNGAYEFAYDGLVKDQYISTVIDKGTQYVYFLRYDIKMGEGDPYNAYEHYDAPMLSIAASKDGYKDCFSYKINSFEIDKDALYAAMKEKGDTELEFTVTLKFPERSTLADTATWTKTITVSLAD